MTKLFCFHDNAILKEELNPKSGMKYRCPQCHCLFGLVLITNDKDCIAKRVKATKPKIIVKETKKKK